MIYVLTIALIASTAGIVAMALRFAGMSSERDRAIFNHNQADIKTQSVASELASFKAETKRARALLLEDIERLENDLQNCDSAGARRERLRRLLSLAKAIAETDRAGHQKAWLS